MATSEPPADRSAAHRLTIPVLATAIALTCALTACESTTDGGRPPGQPSASPGHGSGAAVRTGPLRIFVEAPNESATVRRDQPLFARLADDFNSRRPAGAPVVKIDVHTSEDVLLNPGRTCKLITDEATRPQMILSDNTDFGECPALKGIPIVAPNPALVPARSAEAAERIMLRGVTMEDFSTAMAGYLATDASAAQAARLAVIAGPAFGAEEKAWKTSVDSFAASISQRLGKPVSAHLLPFIDSPSYAAEALALPVRLRKEGVAALVALGAPGGAPFPADKFVSQKFTPPMFGSPLTYMSDFITAGYPAAQVKGLTNFQEGDGDPSTAAVEDRQRMRANPAGQHCLELIDARGRRVPDATFFDLAPVCEWLQLLGAALGRDPAAGDSGAKLLSALSLLGPVDLARGGRADFTGGRRAAAVDLSAVSGDASCSCIRDTGRSYPLIHPTAQHS